MSQDKKHHHHDQTPHSDQGVGDSALKAPVCGMDVGKDSPHHTNHGDDKIYFCSEHCLKKFEENSSNYLTKQKKSVNSERQKNHAFQNETDIYTCPMHPEVKQTGPGSCPKCGMALEPARKTGQEGENPELVDMRRRFWVSLVLTIPVFVLAMGDMIPGNPLAWAISKNVLVWIELLLATPVVFWCGWPFLVRGWQSVVSWNLNMFTLIGLGVSVAYVYSLIATIFPEIFPASFRGKKGTVAVYFEAAASITTLILLGRCWN